VKIAENSNILNARRAFKRRLGGQPHAPMTSPDDVTARPIKIGNPACYKLPATFLLWENPETGYCVSFCQDFYTNKPASSFIFIMLTHVLNYIFKICFSKVELIQ
jgi:hypothetical protein